MPQNIHQATIFLLSLSYDGLLVATIGNQGQPMISLYCSEAMFYHKSVTYLKICLKFENSYYYSLNDCLLEAIIHNHHQTMIDHQFSEAVLHRQ